MSAGRKNDFCDAQTHVQPRAAGVSPPWFCVRTLEAVTCNRIERGAYCCVAATENCGEHRRPRAAGVSPPWFGNTVRTGADFFGLNMFLQRTFGLAHHGWLTPAALDARRWCPENNHIRDVPTPIHNSGGCQPAVVWESRLQKLSIHVRQTTRLTTPGQSSAWFKGGLLPTFGLQLRWVCLFVQRSRSICYRCSVRSCVPAGGSRKPSLLAQT
jgi:hypothetical protein